MCPELSYIIVCFDNINKSRNKKSLEIKKGCVNVVMPDISRESSSKLHCLLRLRNQTGLVVLLQQGEKTPQEEVGKGRHRTARN